MPMTAWPKCKHESGIIALLRFGPARVPDGPSVRWLAERGVVRRTVDGLWEITPGVPTH